METLPLRPPQQRKVAHQVTQPRAARERGGAAGGGSPSTSPPPSPNPGARTCRAEPVGSAPPPPPPRRPRATARHSPRPKRWIGAKQCNPAQVPVRAAACTSRIKRGREDEEALPLLRRVGPLPPPPPPGRSAPRGPLPAAGDNSPETRRGPAQQTSHDSRSPRSSVTSTSGAFLLQPPSTNQGGEKKNPFGRVLESLRKASWERQRGVRDGPSTGTLCSAKVLLGFRTVLAGKEGVAPP